MLSSTESSSGAEPITHYTGLSTEAVASGLKPFTHYTVVLEVGGANSYQVQMYRLSFLFHYDHFQHVQPAKWQTPILIYRHALLGGALLHHHCLFWQLLPPHKTSLHPESVLRDLIHCMSPGSPPVTQMVGPQTYTQTNTDLYTHHVQ